MNFNKRILIAVTLAVPLLLLSFLEYYWQQLSQFAPPIGITSILILTILTITKLISTGLTVLKLRASLTLKRISPTLIYLTTLLLIYIHPDFLNAYKYQSTVKYRGCYEGTMNTGTIIFREDGKFEYKHVGFFGISTFEKGTWKQIEDTLFIDYKTHEFVGSKLFMSEDRFIKVEGDSLVESRVGFYRGFCKRLN